MPGYRRPANVAFVVDSGDDADAGEVVYLSSLPFGSLIVLRGTSALIWQHAVATDGEDLVDGLAVSVGLMSEVIRDDVEAFVHELVERQLLEPVPEDPDEPTEPGASGVSSAASS